MASDTINATLVAGLKKRIGYHTEPSNCGNCRYFLQDGSTDNFGPGDRCQRNPDIIFNTVSHASCLGWAKQN